MNSAFILSQTDGRPLYLQVMDQVKQRVAVGDWLPGDKIPSIRELAVASKVSVITIKRAYLELEQAGVIVTQHGKGSFIAQGAEVSVRVHEQELEKHLAEIVRLATVLGLSAEDLQAQVAARFQSNSEEA